MSSAGSVLDLRVKVVLLATDFSPASVKPLHHALAISRHYRARLYVAHVVSPAAYLMAGPEALELAYQGASGEAQQLQRDLLHDGSLKGLDHVFMIRSGRVWEELQALILQKDVDLVVVGTHGRRAIEKALLGSVAEQVFRDSNCPVLTVGPYSYQESHVELTSAVQTFLFATDFSEASLNALPHAISLARQANAKLILLHIVPVAPVSQIPGWYTSAEITLMRENARMTCVRRLEELMPCDEEAPLECEFLVQFGRPSEKILQLALHNSVDLIVLGLRRASLANAISRMPSATAYEIVCGAGCPVLTVRQ